MKRHKLSRLAQRLRYALLQTPAFTELPRCTGCGLVVKPQDFDPRLGVCWGCSQDRAEMVWDDSDNDRPFLPEEE